MRRRRPFAAADAPVGAGNATADQVIRVLQLFTQDRPIWRVDQIARHFGMSQSTTYRYLGSLRGAGLLIEDGERGFHLGPGVFALARAAKATTSVVRLAAPYLWKLAEAFGAKAAVQERVGDEIVHLDLLEGPKVFTIGARRSLFFPWPTTCAATMLLAHAPEAEREAMTRRMVPAPYNDSTPRDHAALAHAMGEARRQGYAVNDDDVEDVWGVAAPVFSYGLGRYCMALAMPRPRMGKTALPAVVAEVKLAAAQLTTDLGKTEL